MTFDERLADIRQNINDAKLDVLIAVHDGAHFIEKPDPVIVLSGFKSLGPVAVLVGRDGAMTLVVTPSWDAERAAALCPGVKIVATDDVIKGIERSLGPAAQSITVGLAGISTAPWSIAKRLIDLLPLARQTDHIVFDATGRKTDVELANAREATRIAERGYEMLLEIARPGMTEDEIAVEVRWFTRTLGAEDNFLLMSSGPHNRAVAPSYGRRLQSGDVIVVEITPSYRGQLAQICRTITLGEAGKMLRTKYALVLRAMEAGFAIAQPGATMADICRAINAVLEAEGYGEYCYPPHIRRRGHGLGFGSILPGDVSLDNATVLEPDMLFMIHPNQYLPETGYLLCGEPVVMTPRGARPLSEQQSVLAEIPL